MITFEEKLKCGAATLRVYNYVPEEIFGVPTGGGGVVKIDILFNDYTSFLHAICVDREHNLIELFTNRNNLAQIRKALDTVDPPVVSWLSKLEAKLKSWRIL